MLTWYSGTAIPVCQNNCGKLCTGSCCVPQPTGTPPDFTPPSSPTATSAPSNPDSPDDPAPTSAPSDPDNPSFPASGYVQIGITSESASTSNYAWAVIDGDSKSLCDKPLYIEDLHSDSAATPQKLLGPWNKDGLQGVYQPYLGNDETYGNGILYFSTAGPEMGCKGITGQFQSCENYGIRSVSLHWIFPRDDFIRLGSH
ncbi:MAG: hypothetical protein CL912_29670 [Deltaproteobacteria bacterium]|nr:hypothetical protein [Deltaproteobacteria bacterium]